MGAVRDANGDFELDAAVLADAFGVEAETVPVLLRHGEITSRTERGEGPDAGTFRLVFFYRNSRLLLVLDETGSVLRQSLLSFGDRPLPDALRRP